MHVEESNVEADEEEPEMPFAESLVRHATSHLGEPEVEAGEHREQRSTDQHVMEVRDDEIGIVYLGIHRHGCKHHAGKSPNQEDEEESEAPQHGQAHLQTAKIGRA